MKFSAKKLACIFAAVAAVSLLPRAFAALDRSEAHSYREAQMRDVYSTSHAVDKLREAGALSEREFEMRTNLFDACSAENESYKAAIDRGADTDLKWKTFKKICTEAARMR